MEKLVKMAKLIDLSLKVLQILIVAFTVLLLVFSGFSGVWFYLPVDGVFHLSGVNGATVFLSAPVGWSLFLAAAAVVLYGLHILRRILRPMKQGEPFAQSVSADMRHFGWLVLIAGGILSLASFAGQLSLLSSSSSATNGSFQLDLSFLFLSAIVFLFSYIFRYGEELQRQADETL